MAEICLWSAMGAEAPTPYRYGVWGAATPSQRHAIADALGHPGAGEYLQRLQDALGAWQTDHGAQGATDAA